MDRAVTELPSLWLSPEARRGTSSVLPCSSSSRGFRASTRPGAIQLGFGFYFTARGVKIRVAPKAFARLKARLRVLTSRRWSVSMAYRITVLNRFVRGWMGYFRLAETPRKFADLDEWFRRRMRQIRWKEWKRPRTRIRRLRSLGIRADLARQWGMSSRGYWRIAKSPILHRALPSSYWDDLGLLVFRRAWEVFQ
ncbi:group II intron maturase-specific domain-containing protein [Brevibacterium luteolum]|uniref:group II intron maturase-specific domain-containing protein n=1 Tax=Brevibacterium luteolum TaxID=199591 RepID=UPI00223B4CAA|nr:group II intron maturase-specific domain-containing protein [Brevibacterium luteolum]